MQAAGIDVTIPNGSAKVRAAVLAALEDADNEVPMALRATLANQLERIAGFQADMAAIEKRLTEEAGSDEVSQLPCGRAAGSAPSTSTTTSTANR